MPFTKMVEFVFVVERLIMRQPIVALAIGAGNIITVLINPALVFAKVVFLRHLTQGVVGVDFAGSPSVDVMMFIRRVFGFEFPFLDSTATGSDALVIVCAAIMTSSLLFVFYRVVVSGATSAHLLLPIAFAWYVVSAAIAINSGQSANYYGAAKVLLISLPFVPILWAIGLADCRDRRAVRTILCVIPIALIFLELVVVSKAAGIIVSMPTFFSATFANGVVSMSKHDYVTYIMSDHPHVVNYWLNIMRVNDITAIFLSGRQRATWFRQPYNPEVHRSGLLDGIDEATTRGDHSYIVPRYCQALPGFSLVVLSAECRLEVPAAAPVLTSRNTDVFIIGP